MTLLTLMTLLVARALLLWLPLLKNRNLQTSLLIVANRPDLGSVNKIFSSRFNTLLWLFDMQGWRKWGLVGGVQAQLLENFLVTLGAGTTRFCWVRNINLVF